MRSVQPARLGVPVSAGMSDETHVIPGNLHYGWTLILDYSDDWAHVNFWMVPVTGENTEGRVLYGELAHTLIPNKSFAEIHGSVKWDGCTNWSTRDDVMVHNCGLDDMKRLTEALQGAYEEAFILMGDKTWPDARPEE